MPELIKIMIIALAVVLPITIFIVNSFDHKDKIKNNIGTGILIKKSRKNATLYKLYRFFLGIPITRGFIEDTRRRYELLYPGDLKELATKTMKTVLMSWVLCLLSVGLILKSGLNFNNTAVSLILVYVINTELIGFMVMHTEIKLLHEIAMFLSNVRHNYYINRMVDDAIFLSMEGLGYEMRVHANKLYEIVMSNNLKEDVANYNATISNKYLKMFLSLCVGVLEKNSDRKVNGQLLFTANLENLKKEVDIEILKQRKIQFLFSGVSLVTIAVIIPIDSIKNYGVSMMTELEGFYNGRAGIICVSVTLIITMAIYLLNNRLKGINRIPIRNPGYLKKFEKIQCIKRALDNYTEKNYGRMLILSKDLKRLGENISARQFILKRLIFSVSAFVLVNIFFIYLHENNKDNIISAVHNVDTLTTAASTSQLDKMEAYILDYVNTFKNEEVTIEEVLNEVKSNNSFYNVKVCEAIAEEIFIRISAYQNEYYKWYELLVSLTIAAVAYYVPYFLLWYKKKVFQMGMEDEVNQFNSIIFMLMYNEHLTIRDILEELELFAVVFKESIQECLNEFNSGELEALERIKERETFLPFRRLIDNLIRCDAISIDKAFDEIACDRENYHDRRKQENEISVQRRADIAKPLSFIPTALVMVYLTLPMILASLNEIEGFREMMNNI